MHKPMQYHKSSRWEALSKRIYLRGMTAASTRVGDEGSTPVSVDHERGLVESGEASSASLHVFCVITEGSRSMS